MPLYDTRMNVNSSLNPSTLPADLQDIVTLFRNDAQDELSINYLEFQSLVLSGGQVYRNELILLFSPQERKLTVPKVHFIHNKTVNFTELLDLLIKLGKAKEFSFLEINEVSGTELTKVLQKSGFQRETRSYPLAMSFLKSNFWLLDLN
ncbi:hypothetical protein [Bacillus sp. 2205SS5-2]|uniref:hypothetical protein n=1 Tax=Bacillus sp. 2205SS5-2 TaxID=3109031 RepID=UPI003004DBBF